MAVVAVDADLIALPVRGWDYLHAKDGNLFALRGQRLLLSRKK